MIAPSASPRAVARMIAVASGKGGVGKTNLVANLGCCLAQAHQNVLLVDADFALGNLDIVLNVHPRLNIAHALGAGRHLEEVIDTGPLGLDLLAGASGSERMADLDARQRQRLRQELHELRDRYDLILVDNGAGIGRPVVEFCLQAQQVLVVVTPEATSLTDGYSLIKVLVRNHYTGRIAVVVNQADSLLQGKSVYRRLASVTSQFLDYRIVCGAVLLQDDHLRSAVARREAVVLAYPGAAITRGLTALAGRVGQRQARDTLDTAPLLRKVAGWFSS